MVILQSRLKMCFNFRQVFDLPADEKSELVNDEHSRMKVRGNLKKKISRWRFKTLFFIMFFNSEKNLEAMIYMFCVLSKVQSFLVLIY